MTRNIYKFKRQYWYHERTGKPYAVWYASCTFPTGKYFSAQAPDKRAALLSLQRVMREAQHSAHLAVQYLQKQVEKEKRVWT
jgi:hypothetical protein